MKYILPIMLLCFQMKAQFIPTVTWTYAINSACFGSAAAADMDNDGKKEIVFSTYAEDGKVHCLNAENGTIKWIYNIGGCGDVALNIYDLDMDGQLDVFVHASCNDKAFCINGNTGTLTWSATAGGGDSPATIADIDKDGRPELVFGNFSGQIKVLNGENGTTAKTIQVHTGAIQTEPVLVDVNNDNNLDIIVANYFTISNTNFIRCYDYNTATPIWTNTYSSVDSYHAYHGGALADIDKDGKKEYVIGTKSGAVRALNVEDGSALWTLNHPGSSCFHAISIADMDKDDTLDVIYHVENPDEQINIVNGYNGKPVYTYTTNGIFSDFRGSAISDVNGNGKLDLVSSAYMGKVRAIEPFVGTLWTFDALPYFPYPATIPYLSSSNAPLVADFDNDGALDVFFVMGYGDINISPNSIGKAFMIKAGAGTCPEWLMFRRDQNRTGYLSPTDVLFACAVPSGVDEMQSVNGNVKITPQPFNDITEISVTGMNLKEVTIKIIDMDGRLIESRKAAELMQRENEVYWQWNSVNVAPGIYLYQIEDGSRTLNGKLLKTR